MRAIDKVYIHCSAIPWGTVESIRSFHVEQRKWDDIGYHFVITNGWDSHSSMPANFKPSEDGRVHPGRPIDHIGAHVLGDNKSSIGICLVGYNCFSVKQFKSLIQLCRDLMKSYGIKADQVFGHREFWQNQGQPIQKECPYFDVALVRQILSGPQSV